MTPVLSITRRRPAPPARRVDRAALVQRLSEGLALGRPLTLVSAPAGFGKTTCVAEWLAVPDRPVAWLSLSADDDAPEHFFPALIAALEELRPHLGSDWPQELSKVNGALRTGQLPPAAAIAGAWLSDILAAPRPFLLVLDDFHCLQDPFILGVFEQLIGRLFQPYLPQPLHLTLLTREDPPLPLARLRANNQLTEIRAQELRFSRDEARAFLAGVMGLDLSEGEVAALEARTEGWAAGLQLAGLSLRGQADVSGVIHGLRGNQRFILSYLTEEVLHRQTAAVQQFLLATSILDRLSGDLCNALTGRTDSAMLLEQLYRANLFLIPLDDEQRWYRYHHLFADLLRNRQGVTQGDRTAELHRQASRWYARACLERGAGERADLARQAVRHALAAADPHEAAELIEAHSTELLGQWHVKMVQEWLRLLPVEWRARCPRTNLALAHLHLRRADFAEAAPYLERLEATLAATPTPAPDLKAEALVLQSARLMAQGRPLDALTLAEQARDLAPEKALDTRGRVLLALATAHQHLDEPAQAEADYRQLIHLGRVTGDLMTELLGISALALMLVERGQLRAGFALAAEGVAQVERAGYVPPIGAGLYGLLGQIAFNRGELDQADRDLRRAAEVSALSGFSDAVLFHAVTRSRMSQMRGDWAAAEVEIGRALPAMRADAPIVVREELMAQRVNVLLAQKRLADAEQMFAQGLLASTGAGSLASLEPGQALSYAHGVLYNCGLRVQLHRVRFQLAAPSPPEWPNLADRLVAAFLRQQYVPLALEALLLRAQLQSVHGETPASQGDLTAAVDLAEPEAYVSVFLLEGPPIAEALGGLLARSEPGGRRVRFIRTILAMWASLREGPPAASVEPTVNRQPPGLVETLTERELEVLRLMQAGQTYAEIAGRLVVSINTVRSHVKSIYGKLGVNNRTAALGTARSLKLL